MPDSEDLESLWKDALAAYEKETGRKLNHDPLLQRLESTDNLLEQIESEGQAFHDWRNKHRKLWSALSAFLGPVTAVGGVALTAVSNFPPAAAVLGSILYLVKSCEQVNNAYDWVEQIFAELQEFSDRLTQYAKSGMDAILRKKVIAILTFIVRIIGRSEVLIREKRFPKGEYLRVTFLGKDDKTKALLDDLNKSMKNEQSYVLAVTYSSAKATEEIAGRTERTVGKTSEDVQRLTQTVESLSAAAKESRDKEAEKEDDEALQHVLEDTSASKDVEEQFSTYRRSLLKGSGAWLQKEPLFDTWIGQRAPILWVFGGPGAGKSYLSTWTILRLLELHDQRPDYGDGVSVGYFYIKENKEILRDPNVILKTLAWQITLVDRLFRKHAAGVCKSPRSTITAEDTWENLFLDFYQSDRARDRHAIIVLDGLDEAPPAARMTLLGFLRNIVAGGRATTRARIQVAVFGRSTLRGDMQFRREEKYIEVSSVKNRSDIDSYIQKRLEEVELLKELRKAKPNGPQQANKTGKRIKKKVLDGADGVFLWAKLLLDQIIKKDLTQIEKILANPPPNLDEMIWSVFDRLAKDQDMDHESVKRMLAWVAYARRPLFFGEIDLILSLPTRRPNFLLWASLRGRFASIFDLKFPKGYDPAEDDGATSNPKETDLEDDSQSTQEEEETPAFDFTGDDDEDEDGESDIELADGDVLSVEADRGLERLAVTGSSDDRRESVHIFSDGQLKTVVTFSHQRIRDYLVREGSAKTRRKAAMDIYPDVQRVQLDMTMTCLEILRLGLALKADTQYLVDYPAKHFVWHLEGIDMKGVRDEEKRQILDGLYWLFHELTGIKSLFIAAGDGEDDGYDVFWRTWLGSNRHTEVLRTWFGESESVASGFGDDAKAWMKSASGSIKELLRPLATTAATQWLTKPGYDSEEYLNKSEFLVWVLQGYFGLDDKGVITDELRDFAWYKSNMENISAEQLQHLAEWAQLEQTTHWHTGLGWILMEGYYYEKATSHFKEALDQDSAAWVAKEGLARCLGEQGLYGEAIEWMENAIESLPSNMSWLAGYLFPRIAEWKRAMGDHEGAFEAAERAYAAEGSSALAQLRYLEALDASQFSDAIIQVVEELDGWEVLEKDYSYLVRFFMLGYNAYDEIGKACRARGKPGFVLAAMDRAMSLIDQSDNESMQIWLPAQIAAFRYDYYDQVDEPMLLWETAIKRIDAGDSAAQKSSAKTRKIYSNRLAQLYFDAAVASRNAEPRSDQYAMKLKGLSVVTETSADDNDAFDFYGTGYASMLWGRWLRDYQGAGEGVWRKCFKARALEEMDMLDDNDPSNDERGLHALAVTLLQAGDRTNAGAILAVLFKPLEDLPTQQVIQDGDSDPANGGDDETDEQNGGADDAGEPYRSDLANGGKGETDEHDGGADDAEGPCRIQELPDPTTQPVTDGGDTNVLSSEGTLKSEAALLMARGMSEASLQTPQINEPRTVFGPKNLEDVRPTSLVSVTRQTASQLKLELGNSWMYTCDGCFRDPQEAGEMYFCEICLNKNYCGDCLPKVKEGSLWSRQCDPNHTHYRAWPIPSDARDMAVEWVEGEAALRIEWLEKLRKEWMA